MSILVVCPKCKKELKCPDGAVGERVRCSKCHSIVDVLAPGAVASTPPASSPASAPAPAPKPEPAATPASVPPSAPTPAPTVEVGTVAEAPAAPKARRRLWPVLSGVGVAVVIVALVVSWRVTVARDNDAYKAAQERSDAAGKNTAEAIAALESYLKQNPHGLHVTEARERIGALDDAEFAAAEAVAKAEGASFENAIESYRKYLATLPQGGHAEEARRRAEQELPGSWDDYTFTTAETQARDALAAGDQEKAIAAYQEYLKRFPQGLHAPAARNAVEKDLPAAMETREFDKAKTAADAASTKGDFVAAMTSYRDYVQRFPQGRHVAEARQALDKDLPAQVDTQQFEKAKAAAVAASAKSEDEAALAAYREYLNRFPQGQHVAAAKQALEKDLPVQAEAREFEKAKATAAEDTERGLAAYQDLLKRFPQGEHAAAAKQAAETDLPAQIETREYEKATAAAKEDPERGLAAYQEYLKRFPQGPHVAAAMKAAETDLPTLIETRDFEKTKVSADALIAKEDFEGAIAAYQEYLKRFPKGLRAVDVRAVVEVSLPAQLRARDARKSREEAAKKAEALKAAMADPANRVTLVSKCPGVIRYVFFVGTKQVTGQVAAGQKTQVFLPVEPDKFSATHINQDKTEGTLQQDGGNARGKTWTFTYDQKANPKELKMDVSTE